MTRVGCRSGSRCSASRGAGGLVALALACALTPPLAAQAPATIRTEVDTSLVTVGDRITLTVAVQHDAGAEVRWPDSVSLAPFEVLGARVLPARIEDGRAVSGLQLSLAAFELGELEIPSFPVVIESASGAAATLETDPYVVEIRSVGADEGGDIREIRGPLGIPVGPLGFLLALLLVLVPALLAFFLYRRFQPRADEDGAGVRGPPPRPAHEIALEQLRELQASGMLERGQVKEFHIRASEIVRTYVERRFRVDALEMTTFEVLAALERAGVDPDFHAGLRRFLDQCDLVKFAKARPDPARSGQLLELARTLVESTIPAVPIPDVDEERPMEEGEPAPVTVEDGSGAAGVRSSSVSPPHAAARPGGR